MGVYTAIPMYGGSRRVYRNAPRPRPNRRDIVRTNDRFDRHRKHTQKGFIMAKFQKVPFIAAILMCAATVVPAAADELHDICVTVVESEGQPEGTAGCDCMVEKSAGDQALTDELIAQGSVAADQRTFSEAGQAVMEACFPSMSQ